MTEKKYTWEDFIREVFLAEKRPLSSDEIWSIGFKMGLNDKLKTKGKTPQESIGAKIYVDMRNNGENSKYEKVPDSNHVMFLLKECGLSPETIKKYVDTIDEEGTKEKVKFHERDLHSLLTKYVYSNKNFKCLTKTIYHEESSKKLKGSNEWLHPDLVGVYYPFEDYENITLDLQRAQNYSSVKLYSFEMKISVSMGTLRQYYFQAVSNSSWAHEGYLVCLEIDKDETFLNELERLNNAFGIGVIKLNPENIEESEIIIPAKKKDNLDWETIDRLVKVSPGFSDFIDSVNIAMKHNRLLQEQCYDKILSDEDFEKYLKEKKIL